MLKDTRSSPILVTHDTTRDRSGSSWGSAESGSPRLRGSVRLRGFILAVACLVLGGSAGFLAGEMAAHELAHRRGACAALHIAAAHGYLSERQQQFVMRTLTTAINPDVDLFAGGYRALRETCDAALAR